MIFTILKQYIFGYVSIRVESVFIERFLNICASKKILIWNIKRENAAILYANIGIKDFMKIKSIAKKTKSIIKIQRKRGIPFIFSRYKKRKIFLILFIIFSAMLIVLSNFIWNIEIQGIENIPEQEIYKILSEEGIKIGKLKSKINTMQSINSIRLKRSDISWIGITIKGTNVIVNVKEAYIAPKIISKEEFCNVVADKTGIITKIDVQDGTAAVKVGDIVREGDVLIFGYIEGKYTGRRYVHAMGNTAAKVWYSKKGQFAYNECIPKYTGKVENKYEIYINNFRINFYKTLSKFKNYDTIIKDKKLIFFPNFYLPIIISKKTNKEYELIEENYTEEQLIEKATSKLTLELLNDIGNNEENIIDRKVNINKSEDYIEVELIYEVMETIGISEKIYI